MHHELETLADPGAVAKAGAAFVAARARAALAARGSFHFAMSGGHTPWAMFAELASQAVFRAAALASPASRRRR